MERIVLMHVLNTIRQLNMIEQQQEHKQVVQDTRPRLQTLTLSSKHLHNRTLNPFKPNIGKLLRIYTCLIFYNTWIIRSKIFGSM